MDWMRNEYNLKKTYDTQRDLIETYQTDGNVSKKNERELYIRPFSRTPNKKSKATSHSTP